MDERMRSAVETFQAAVRMDQERKKRERRRKELLWGSLALAAALLLCLGAVSARYRTRFLPRTEVCGLDVSGLTAEEAADRLKAGLDGAKLRLRDPEAGEDILTLALGELLPPEALLEQTRTLLAVQHQGKGPLAWARRGTDSLAPALLGSLTEERALAVLEERLYGQTERVYPQPARLVLGESGYTLEREVPGNIVRLELCAPAVVRAAGEVTELSAVSERVLELPQALDRPTLVTESCSMRHRVSVLEAYLRRPVTLDFQNGNVYTLTPEDIWSVSSFTLTDNSVKCVPEPELVRELAAALAEEYGSDGVYAKFRNVEPTREYIYYRVGDRGWIMDKDALGEALLGALKNKAGATVTPDYDCTWYWQDYYGCGNTFIEVSLDNQYLWMFVDGKLLVETPVVTGDLATRHGTHPGFFWIAHKVADTNLVGPTWNDHVDYWMPFDIPNEIGFHDSSWRDEYGGDIYLETGSHGCVNTPLEAMAVIYENSRVGTTVIVY